MKVKTAYLYTAGAIALGLWWWLRRSPTAASSPPAVAGTVTSGNQSTVIDANVMSPGFGLPLLN